MEAFMKKRFVVLTALLMAVFGSGASLFAEAQMNGEAEMAYCAVADLQDAYGEDRVNAWAQLDPDRVDRAINSASAEIDGYLLSGGYTVPLTGTPATINKYCVDIACANLVISAGVLDQDPGGKAVIDQADIARKYLDKVAQGKYKIPGYALDADGNAEQDAPPVGNIQYRSMRRMNLRGY
jgi:phage gp36-like protein